MKNKVILIISIVLLVGIYFNWINATDLTISSNTNLCGLQTYDNVVINANVTICAWNGTGLNGTLDFEVKNFTLSSGSYIFGNGKGYNSANGPGKGSGQSSGGGYGGTGGNGGGGGTGGSTYGSSNNVTLPGSGGGPSPHNAGGSGGAYLKINSTGIVNISGVINMNGSSGAFFSCDNGIGGGSGGGVFIRTSSKLIGNGIITADGGLGNPCGGDYAGGGGGGRIYFEYSLNSSSINSSVLGVGSTWGNNYRGQNGTILYNNTNIPAIVYLSTPNYYNFSTRNVNLSYNITDDSGINVNNVSLILNGIVNQSYNTSNYTSLNVNQNFTIYNLIDGLYSWLINVTDSSGAVSNSSNYTFTLDATNPLISYDSNQINFANLSQNNVFVNVTFIETNFKNITFNLYNSTWNNITTFNTSTTNINFTNLQDGKYWYFVNITDIVNNINSTSIYNVTLDTTKPQILINYPTNGTNSSNINLNVNFTRSDINLDSCWYSNDSYNINTTLTNCNNITNVNWSQGLHTVIIWVNDTGNNINSSNVSFFIDSTMPTITWLYPTDDGLISPSLTNQFNLSVSDSGIGLDSCWWSNSSGLYNFSISCGNNITDTESIDGNYNITFWANDSLNNVNYLVRQFKINSLGPIITLLSPNNLEWLNHNNVIFNFNVIDTNPIDTCQLWGNWSGGWNLNQTNTSIVSKNGTIYNFNSINLSDGNYFWNVKCNDTTNKIGWYGINRSFGVDTIYPTSFIVSITPIPGFKNFKFNSFASDTNLYNCSYSVYNSTNGIDNNLQNINVSCNGDSPLITVSNYDLYTLKFYASDYAGNVNQSSMIFITSSSTGGSNIVGGGGSTTIIQSNNLQGFCGDGICDESFIYDGKATIKDHWNCPSDCPGYNFDELISGLTSNCFGLTNGTCIWLSNLQNNGTCGDNICSSSENQLFCPKDCGYLDSNTLLFNCIGSKGDCFYTSSLGIIFVIIILLSGIFLYFYKIDYQGKRLNIPSYYYSKFKRRKSVKQ